MNGDDRKYTVVVVVYKYMLAETIILKAMVNNVMLIECFMKLFTLNRYC